MAQAIGRVYHTKSRAWVIWKCFFRKISFWFSCYHIIDTSISLAFSLFNMGFSSSIFQTVFRKLIRCSLKNIFHLTNIRNFVFPFIHFAIMYIPDWSVSHLLFFRLWSVQEGLAPGEEHFFQSRHFINDIVMHVGTQKLNFNKWQRG